MEKACIIGLSGTGKTNLLKLLFLLRLPRDWKTKLDGSSYELVNNVAFKVISSGNDELVACFKESFEDSYALSENLMTAFNKADLSYDEILKEDFATPNSHVEDIFRFMKGESKKNEKLIYFPVGLKYDFKETTSRDSYPSRRVFNFSKENLCYMVC